ncbi:MAG: CRISPR-associated endonuclease Cas1 [Blastocatellia bacterium]|nr:CRISPR-associated endonuclease Cas1 [Blastocatellia bacterium]
MLNEFTYCPRLFYLEYVQQEWAESVDTLEGRFLHRRVDQETGQMPSTISEQVQIHARSVTLGSQTLGAIARIDLIESIESTPDEVIPVDYKRGAAPDIAEGAYEPERVQLCLQGLLLRENGYNCNSGVIYFAASNRRVSVEFTSQLITRTLDLLAEAKLTATSSLMPPPLKDSPKCPRCSLVGICLPDEVNLLHAINKEPITSTDKGSLSNYPPLRRLFAANDDQIPLYVQGQGYSVGLKAEVLEIRDKGKTVDQARLIEISQLNLFGNVQLSAQAIRELASRQIVILHLSYGGWLTAITTPPPHKNIELRCKQFLSASNEETCLTLAKSFVSGKIRNAKTMLRRNAENLPEGLLQRLTDARDKAERAHSLEQLLGIEGMAARDYFSCFALMFKSDENSTAFNFEQRNRRPPKDPVNALLSFLYSLLVKDMVATLIAVGFDPYLGFYHQPRYGRPALALDLMEEFRPIIADSVVISLINRGEIKPSNFTARAGAVALNEAGRKRVIEAYEKRLATSVTHPLFGYTITYRRVLEVQARLLARFLNGEIETYPAVVTR